MPKRLFVAALVLLLSPLGARGQSLEEEDRERLQAAAPPGPTDQSPDLEQAARVIVENTNAFRRQHDRAPVQAKPQLTDAARYFADYMARHDVYGHTADGQRPAQRAAEHGYEYCIVSENIAYQFSSAGFSTEELAQRFVQGWKDSPEHRENMLDPDVTETGVAVAQSEQTGYYYAVQMFGRPKSQSIAFEVVNQSGATVTYQIGERQFPLPPRYTRTHERCRPAELTFQLSDPQADGRTKTVQPDDGDRFVVTGQAGGLALQEQ